MMVMMTTAAAAVRRRANRRTARALARGLTRGMLSSPMEPMAPVHGRSPKWVSADHAVQRIQSGNRVLIQGQAATPEYLVQAMVRWGARGALRDVETVHLHLEGDGPLPADDEATYSRAAESFCPNNLFIGPNQRKAVADGHADFIPIFLSEIPLLFRRGILPLDVALIQVSPPDKHGFCSLGVSVDIVRAGLECAQYVIGQVNQMMPRTHGDGVIHISHFDAVVHRDAPIHERTPVQPSAEDRAIGKLIADELVVDGATLQMGIGTIPDVVLSHLTSHKDLGIHTEMFSDGVLQLIHRDVLTNARKPKHRGKIVSSFCVGSRTLYDFIDDNATVEMLDIAYVNNPSVVATMPAMTAINSAIEIDLTGQIVADSIGTRMYSGVGGQVDFIRGASLCPDGKPIIALPSRTKKGRSRIVPTLNEGAGVVTTRAHARYVVTEYGIAYLFGKNLRQRAKALIDIAHPDDRESLERAAHERFKQFP